jgi:hypothetical protein
MLHNAFGVAAAHIFRKVNAYGALPHKHEHSAHGDGDRAHLYAEGVP